MQQPTEEHLVEEVTGIVWRKRRLRLAGAAAHREALYDTIDTYSKTARVASAHLHKAKPQKVWKMSELGQSRRSESVSMTSGLPR